MNQASTIYIAGHTGLVGSALVRHLQKEGYHHLLLRTHEQLDLTNQQAVELFFAKEKPEYVIVAAGKVGGIKANTEEPADFFYVNMAIANHVIWSAYRNKVQKLLYLGSACMYPKECPQPMKEEYLLTGLPEITNEGYALAKISGSRLCSYLRRQHSVDFISAIPANAYGPNDCFDSEKSHVIPALLMKYQNAKIHNEPHVLLWGTGAVKREFIHTDDLADACLFLMQHYSSAEPINVGTGEEITIMELSQMIKQIVGFQGSIECDANKPDGMPRRMLDSSRLAAMGWRAKICLAQGLQDVYKQHIHDIGKAEM